MKCCICNNDYGHNAEPLAHGKCCDICNYKYVIRARLLESEVKNIETRDLPSYISGYDAYIEDAEEVEENDDDMYEEYLIEKEI